MLTGPSPPQVLVPDLYHDPELAQDEVDLVDDVIDLPELLRVEAMEIVEQSAQLAEQSLEDRKMKTSSP
jgi:hypothetical protein